ncbi:MAG: hypothetical protein Q9227_001565 [Pyrenula ochraceoflavens]
MPFRSIGHDSDRELSDIADLLAKSRKIVLVTGAGISTSCGIPDFRSKEGLYSLLPEDAISSSQEPSVQSSPSTPSRKRKRDADEGDALPCSSQDSVLSTSSRRTAPNTPTKLRGQDLFDARVWKDAHSTSVFYRFIASLRQKIRKEVKETSQTHKFIRTLRDGGRLMRCYTQNIDGLERREGLATDLAKGQGNKRRFMKKVYESPRPALISDGDEMDGGCEVVQLHGDLDSLRCNLCHNTCNWSDADTEIFLQGEAPICQSCHAKSEDRRNRGKREMSVGLLRPNIVLYNEAHPFDQLLAPIPPYDVFQSPDVMIIMGTSLKVHGLQKLIREFAKSIHSRKNKGRVIFVNRTRPAESVWSDVIDDWVSMDCDGWVLDLKSRREDIWLRQGELDLSVTKPRTVRASPKRKRGNGIHVFAEEGSVSRSERMVSVTVPMSSSSFKDTSTRSITPDESTITTIQALPTPPPSREKFKWTGHRKPEISSFKRNFTPWRDDNDWEQQQIYQQRESPPYEKLKDVTSPIKKMVLQPKSSSAMNIGALLHQVAGQKAKPL